MPDVDAEIASQPDCWRAADEARAALPPAAPRPASAWPSSAAAPRCSWPRPTPPCASRPGTARPTPSPPRVPACGRGYDRRARDHPVRHHHRGPRAARPRCAAGRRPPRRIIGDAGHPGHRARRRASSCSTWPTSSRWCRPASPPPRWPCCAPPSARTSAAPSRTPARCWPQDEAAAWAARATPSSSPSSAAAGPSGWPRRRR